MRARFAHAPFVLPALLLATGAALGVTMDGPATESPPKERKASSPKLGEIPALVTALSAEDWHAREKAMRQLIDLGDAARPALREAVRGQDPEARWRATYALSLLELTLEPIEADAARTLYASAARARAQKDGAEAAKRLYAEVVERFPSTRWGVAARERLASLKAEKRPRNPTAPSPEAIAQLVAQLAHASWAERQEASRRLAQLGEAARPALSAAAEGPDTETAWRARRLLGRLQAEPPPLKPRTPGDGVKLAIELAGHRIRGKSQPSDASDLDALVRSLSSEDSRDIARAREVLLNVAKDSLAPLLRALDGCDEATGVEIMDLLRQITREDIGFDPDRWQAWWQERRERGKPE